VTTTVAEVFDEPAAWRAAIIDELCLRGERRQAAASPGPGFPQLAGLLVSSLQQAPPGAVVDVGGGLGGLTDRLDRSTARTCVLVEPSAHSIASAVRLFPSIAAVRAPAEQLPVRSGSCAGVVLCGVVSLMTDIEPWLHEAQRVLRPEGVLFVADLWSSSSTSIVRPPNRFWSVEEVSEHASRAGFVRHDVAVCEPTVGSWSDVGRAVAERMHRRHGVDAALQRWEEDRRHLDDVVARGEVVAGGVTYVRRSPS
jgi:SAM-dependent methyltransferase